MFPAFHLLQKLYSCAARKLKITVKINVSTLFLHSSFHSFSYRLLRFRVMGGIAGYLQQSLCESPCCILNINVHVILIKAIKSCWRQTKEPHVAPEPQVEHPWFIPAVLFIKIYSIPSISCTFWGCNVFLMLNNSCLCADDKSLRPFFVTFAVLEINKKKW